MDKFIAIGPLISVNNSGADYNLQNLNEYMKGDISFKVTDNIAHGLIEKTGERNFFRFYNPNPPAKCSDHLRQMFQTGKFAYYKYPKQVVNIKEYQQLEPPEHDLSVIQGFNIHLICGKDDQLAPVKHIKELYLKLCNQNAIELYEYPHGHFGLIMPNDREKKPTYKMVDIIIDQCEQPYTERSTSPYQLRMQKLKQMQSINSDIFGTEPYNQPEKI